MQQAATRYRSSATRLAARQQALDAGIRAVRSAEDRQNAWYNLAMLLAAQNDAAGAEQALRNAIAWAPHWFKPHWALARLLALSGRGAEASEEARMAIECDGGHDPEVAETWKQLTQATRADFHKVFTDSAIVLRPGASPIVSAGAFLCGFVLIALLFVCAGLATGPSSRHFDWWRLERRKFYERPGR